MRSLVLILFFTGVVLFLPGPLFQRMLYFLLGLVLWVRRANRIVGEKIVVQVDTLHSKGFVGDDLFLTLKVANPTGFPVFWCTVRQSFPEGIGGFCQRWALALDAREKKELKVGFRGQRRGIFPVPDVRLTHGDAWGITEKAGILNLPSRLLSIPLSRRWRRNGSSATCHWDGKRLSSGSMRTRRACAGAVNTGPVTA